MSKDYTYQNLIELDKLKKNSKKFASTVRLILKDFLFKNLLSEPSVFSSRPPKNGEEEKFKVHEAFRISPRFLKWALDSTIFYFTNLYKIYP
jgi:mRNA-degrading endonuclease RelE of RelBE toxin-antitoxin system